MSLGGSHAYFGFHYFVSLVLLTSRLFVYVTKYAAQLCLCSMTNKWQAQIETRVILRYRLRLQSQDLSQLSDMHQG